MPSSRLNRPTFPGKQPKLGAICSIIYVKHASGRVRSGPMASPSDLDPRRPKVQAPETCQRPVPRRNPDSRWLGDRRVGVKLGVLAVIAVIAIVVVGVVGRPG
jgi:hypothetical protein